MDAISRGSYTFFITVAILKEFACGSSSLAVRCNCNLDSSRIQSVISFPPEMKKRHLWDISQGIFQFGWSCVVCLLSSFASLWFFENCSKYQKRMSYLLHMEQLTIGSSFLSPISPTSQNFASQRRCDYPQWISK